MNELPAHITTALEALGIDPKDVIIVINSTSEPVELQKLNELAPEPAPLPDEFMEVKERQPETIERYTPRIEKQHPKSCTKPKGMKRPKHRNREAPGVARFFTDQRR